MARVALQNDHCGYCVEDGLEVDQTGSMEFGEEAGAVTQVRDKRAQSKVVVVGLERRGQRDELCEKGEFLGFGD